MVNLNKKKLLEVMNIIGMDYILLENDLIIECDTQLPTLLGYKTKKSIKNRSIYKFLTEDSRDSFTYLLNRVLDINISQTGIKEFALIDKNKKLVFFKIKIIPLSKNNVLLLLMKKEHCLFLSEDFTFIDFFPDIFFISKCNCNNGESYFLFLNSRVKEILGVTPEEIYSIEKENPYFFHKEVLQEDFEEYMNFLKSIKDRKEKKISKIIKVKDNFNNIKFLSLSAELNRKEGEYSIFYGTARDVTELLDTKKKLIAMENKIFKILNLIPHGVLLLSNDFKIKFFNNYFVELFGLPTKIVNILEGSRLYDVAFLNELNISDDIKKSLLKKEYYQKYIWINSEFKLKKIYLRVDGILLTEVYNEVYDVLLLFTDLTGVKELEIELNKEFRYKSIERFASGIAHTFNNILAALESNISFVKEILSSPKPEIDKVTEIIDHAELTSYKAKVITEKLTSLSNTWEPKKEKFSVDDLFYKTIIPQLENFYKNVEFNIKIHNAFVNIDLSKAAFAIKNIYENAVEAIERKGKIKVEAEEYTEPHYKAKKYLNIRIIDNGPGIPDDILNEIFDPFFSTKSIGRGLGLSISNSIIANLGGFIKVNTKINKGTEFSIFIPLVSSSKKEPSTKQLKKGSTFSIGRKILIMDDEEFIRETLKTILGYMGYSIWEAEDVDTAFRIYKEHYEKGEPFDLIIVDLIIPGGSGGLELINLLKKLDKNVKAVVSSGYSSTKILSSYKKHGFIDVLLKPYNFTDLKNLLSKHFKD